VVEAERGPATRPNYYGWQDRIAGDAERPLNGRIVEVADDWERMMREDPHSGVVAYVPRGAVARGEILTRSGGPAGQPCPACHGKTLTGDGEVPPLAGRSPAYLARMLWDFKTGARDAPSAAPMHAVTAPLSEAQITDLVAYLASRAP
jgi:cytochrome c553